MDDTPPFGEIKTEYEIATQSADPIRALENTNEGLVGVVDPVEGFSREVAGTNAAHQSLVDSPRASDVDQDGLRDLSGTTADAFVAGSAQDVDAGLDSYLRSLEQGGGASASSNASTDQAQQSENQRGAGGGHEPLDHIALAPLGRGLGYDVARVDRAGADLLMEEVGEALAAAVDKLWTMSQVSAAKGPLSRRLAETKLYPHEDNPLRFSKTSTDALKALFDRTNPVQLTAGAAVSETLEQFSHHQEMSEKSIDAALELVFAAMSPAFMKRRFTAYAGARKQSTDLSPAECWQLYERYFAELKSDRQTAYAACSGKFLIAAMMSWRATRALIWRGISRCLGSNRWLCPPPYAPFAPLAAWALPLLGGCAVVEMGQKMLEVVKDPEIQVGDDGDQASAASVTFFSQRNANLNAFGEAVPVTVFILQMSGEEGLAAADILEFMDDPAAALGNDFLDVSEHSVPPGAFVNIDAVELLPEATHMGFAALFADPDGANWHAVEAVEPIGKVYTLAIEIAAQQLRVTLEEK